ncbi:MAG: HD domain-containing protein [Planctomycetes bacterium]|nr:HD domain-containing protein [Planctomycetota bacterium]
MPQQDPIRSRAHEDLILVDEDGHQDVFLWEHTDRVARSAGAIADLPEVPRDKLDLVALSAAALYHDAGWAVQFRSGQVQRHAILGKTTNREQRRLAGELLMKQLHGMIETESLRRARDCIEALNQRDPELYEARVLHDAESFDQIGPLLFWRLMRRQALDGKGVEAAIKDWETRKQYGYWDDQVEQFHFDAVRAAARRRLDKMDHLMAELSRQHNGQDLVFDPFDRNSTPTPAP